MAKVGKQGRDDSEYNPLQTSFSTICV